MTHFGIIKGHSTLTHKNKFDRLVCSSDSVTK